MTTPNASSGWWARFTFNGITRYDQGAYDLVGGEELSDAERVELRAQEPWRLGRPQQPAGPLLPLQCRQARCSLPTQEGTTGFRGLQASYASREAGCVFFALESSGRVLLENELTLCIADAYPVTPGHSLVIPRRHGADGLALHQPEWNAVVELLKRRREQLSAQDASISGWNVGLNTGEAAGQTVFHAHWHLIPRREGDCEKPRGGVRGVVPAHQFY
jgi:diadenosine tetraphosphate (Ap4A) HIT family hydrolase